GKETAAGFVVGVGDVVAGLHALAGDLTGPGHDAPRLLESPAMDGRALADGSANGCRPWPGRRRPRRARKGPPRNAGITGSRCGGGGVALPPRPGRRIGRTQRAGHYAGAPGDGQVLRTGAFSRGGGRGGREGGRERI